MPAEGDRDPITRHAKAMPYAPGWSSQRTGSPLAAALGSHRHRIPSCPSASSAKAVVMSRGPVGGGMGWGAIGGGVRGSQRPHAHTPRNKSLEARKHVGTHLCSRVVAAVVPAVLVRLVFFEAASAAAARPWVAAPTAAAVAPGGIHSPPKASPPSFPRTRYLSPCFLTVPRGFRLGVLPWVGTSQPPASLRGLCPRPSTTNSR